MRFPLQVETIKSIKMVVQLFNIVTKIECLVWILVATQNDNSYQEYRLLKGTITIED